MPWPVNFSLHCKESIYGAFCSLCAAVCLKEQTPWDLKGNSQLVFNLGVSTLSWAEGKLLELLQLLKLPV